MHYILATDRDAQGPLQRDEVIAHFGIVRTLRPKTVVEFGFFHGHSAFNFLCALDRDAKLYSFDISDESAARVEREFSFDDRLTFIQKSQTDFRASDMDGRLIDFLFIDASHDLAMKYRDLHQGSLLTGAGSSDRDSRYWSLG